MPTTARGPRPPRAGLARPPRRLSRPAAVGLLALVVLVVSVWLPAWPASAARPLGAGDGTGVGVGTGTGGYVGGLLLPPGSRPQPESLPSTAARCDGCLWTLLPACSRPDLGDATMCTGAALACPLPALRMALWLLRPGQPAAAVVGTLCIDPAVALQPEALMPGVRDRFERLVPPLRPSYEPRGRGLVNLPVLFAAGQPTSLGRPGFELGGRRVELAATVTWVWHLGDGTELRTRSPGGGWPVTTVSHAYRSRGRYDVRVTAQWAGQFWVDGAGPFAVTGPPVTQETVLPVLVVPARSVLVGSG